MTWLTPLTGLFVALAVVPPLLALYFLKLRRRSRDIPSTMLWQRSVQDIRANTPFQRLRMNVLLLLQLLVLLLLVLALAQPQLEMDGRDGGRTVIAIDHSGSMNAIDAGEETTRLERAKEAAISRIEALHSGGLFSGGSESIMVLAFAESAEVRSPFTDSRSQAIAAVRSIGPTDESSMIGEALALARAFTVSTDPEATADFESLEAPAVFELFSDGRLMDVHDEPLRSGESARFTVIGSGSTPNLGLTGIAAERPWNRPGDIQVFVVVSNHSDVATDVDLELRVGGRARAVTPEPLHVPAGQLDEQTGVWLPGRAQAMFVPFQEERGTLIEVRLLHEDALASDNEARLVVPGAKRLRIALTGRDTWFMQKLLEGLSLSGLDVLSPAAYEQAIADGESWDVVLMLGWTPGSLSPGRYLVFESVAGIPELSSFGSSDRVFVRNVQDEHPIFRWAVLDDLFVWKMNQVVASGDTTLLAEAVEGPLVVEVDRGSTHVLWVAFHPLDSTWWRQRSFVNFVPAALDYLSSIGGRVVEKGIEPGDSISMLLEPGSRDATVELTDGQSQPAVVSDDGQLSWGPAHVAGLYRVRWTRPSGDPAEALVGVNMISPTEGHLAASPTINFSIEKISGTRPDSKFQTALWPWLLTIGLTILLAEWLLYHRRL